MTIDKLKIDGGQITVDYSGLMESFRISTSDEAKPSLYTAAADVAVLARVALGIIVEGAGFVAISLSHGDNPGSRIVLSVPTLAGDTAKIACPKIDAATEVDFQTGVVIEGHPRNVYNRAVELLEKEIVAFVKGKRAQMALPFDETPEEREVQREVEKVLAFGGPR